MAVLVVPWRPDGGHRDAIWHRLEADHLNAGRTVIEGTCTGEWCKAAAVADALTRSADDLLVIHDADVWCDSLDEAIGSVLDGAPWAVPHGKVYRLAEGQLEPSTDRRHLDQNAYRGYPGGGIAVVPRSTYDTCPLDPRFVGWGQEDISWALALTRVHGDPWRGTAPLWHWWHPPQARQTRVTGSAAGKALHARYQAARTREAMLDLIGEAHGEGHRHPQPQGHPGPAPLRAGPR